MYISENWLIVRVRFAVFPVNYHTKSWHTPWNEKRPSRDDHSVEVKNESNYSSAPLVRLRGVYPDTFTFTFTCTFTFTFTFTVT